MMPEIKINNNDLLIMNLVHYFITEKNYNPVILHGINDEIWLENMDSDYKIIRTNKIKYAKNLTIEKSYNMYEDLIKVLNTHR